MSKRLLPATLRGKLILSFLGISFLPVLVLTFWNQKATREKLIEEANQNLLAAAAQTALSIDEFTKNKLDTIRVEAQLPIFAQYLSFPENHRQDLATEVDATLQVLIRKDILNITSYALLDRQGRVTLDTYTPNIGQLHADRDYFQKPITTGLPSVSSVYYASAYKAPTLQFSSPVRDRSGKILGVLSLRYNAAVIQQLINQNTRSVKGRDAFAILLDENDIRVAQGNAPTLILKPIAPLASERVQSLQAAGRLQPKEQLDSSAYLPELKHGLESAAKSPFFTLSLDNDRKAAAVTRLRTKPWHLVFVQSQSRFLAPIETEVRNVLFLAGIMVGIAIVAALVCGQVLAKPLIDLADTVAEFTQGDRNARTSIQTNDEIGRLAINFNMMAEEITGLLQGLEARRQELEETLQKLQKTQFQLIQSEKMSSLGQLVAGVAHEINNPVSFIHGNLEPTQEYIQDLLQLVDLYQQAYPHPAAAITDKIEGIDLEFIKEDITKLLASMQIGTSRIREIVLSLRNFSRLDEAELKTIDIHEGIDSTLMILQNRLKATADRFGIEVIKNYSQLPPVECFPGQLNQVFMNLLANAIDALEELGMRNQGAKSSNSYCPTICISTELLDCHWVAIRIVDNGSGISEAVKSKLFDPFFTTKPVGKGTGLGLSISYQIVVERHGGKLSVVSTPGAGTEFAIQIPVKQPTQVENSVGCIPFL